MVLPATSPSHPAVPALPRPFTAPAPHKGSYTVQAGDTLGEIGTKLGKDWHQVFTENKDLLHDPNMIQPGQQLKVG